MAFEFEKTDIQWVILVKPKIFGDERWFFMETYNKKDFDHFLQFAPISLEEKFKKNNFTYDEIEKEAGKLLKINYSIHYHVFLENIVRDIIEYWDKHKIFHFFIIDKKSTTNIKLDNEFVLILQKY